MKPRSQQLTGVLTNSGSIYLTGSINASQGFTGSLQGTASYALTASYSSNIFGQPYYIPTFTGNGALATSSIFQSGSFTSIRYETVPEDPNNPDILYVAGYEVDTYNLISAHSDLDSYVQLNVQNFSPMSSASSDIVATADTGTETDHYIDMGINGSGYNDPAGVGNALDAYLYSTGQDLLIGNATDGNKVIIFNGDGPALDNARVFIDSIGTVGINANDPTTGNPEALLVEAINNTTYNLIKAKGNVDNFLQSAIANRNSGSAASADIVAYNNLDPNSSAFGFIDMGINSSNFNDPINYPGWDAGDSYLYTDAPRLTIGSSNNTGSISFYVGNVNPTSGSKFQLRANNNHSLSGSLNVSGSITAFSFTGSLLGTASNASTASYAPLYLPLTGGTINGDVILNGTASISYLNVLVESASVIYSSGSNQFGDATNDVQTLIGRVKVSGSLEVTGSIDVASGSLIIRSSSFNGIGLESTLPSANLHINNPNNNSTFLRIDKSNSALFDFIKGGSLGSHAMRVYSEGASVIGQLGARNSSGIISLNMQGVLGSTTNDTSAGIDFTTTGTGGGGNPSFLFRNTSTVGYDVYAGVIKPGLLRLQGTHGASSGTGEYAAIRIANTINQTGGSGINFGIVYEPILTSIAGAHYGLVIRPSNTLNGIGLTTNLPTATWHVKGNSDTTGDILRLENLSNNSSFNFTNAGTFQIYSNSNPALGFDGGNLFFGSPYVNYGRYITQTFQFSGNIGVGRYDGMQLINNIGNPLQDTSGNYRAFSIISNHQSNAVSAFAPTSGDATFTNIQINTVIEQGGTATGRVVAFDYTPTINSITGAHYGILIRPSTLNGFGLGNTFPTASLHIRGGLTGSILKIESNVSSSILTIDNNGSGSFVGFLATTGSLLGTASYATSASYAPVFPYTGSALITGSLGVTGSVSVLGNSNFSAISTGSSVVFKAGTRELQFGSTASFASDYNGVNNVSIIQSTNSNTSSSLKINPYGGDVHIGSRNSNVIIGNVTDNTNSNTSVIIAGGDANLTAPGLLVSARGISVGMKLYGYGDDGNYGGSMIEGYLNKILLKNQAVYIGYSSDGTFAASQATNARLEINGSYRTMANSSAINQSSNYYQKISWTKSSGVDAYSYMMIGSHTTSSMGLQMKVSADTITYTNGNITLNPYGGNVGVGVSTVPQASLHIKGDSDTTGNILTAQNLSNTSYLTFNNSGVLTTNQPSGGSNYTTFDFLRGGSSWLSLGSRAGLGQGLFFGNQVASVTLNQSTLTLTAATSNNDLGAAIDFVNTNTTAAGSPQFRFRNEGTLAYSFGSNPVTVRSFQILHNLSVSTGNSSQFITTLNINPTYNQTAGGVGLVGIDYDPTITSITGAHYGLLLRSSTLNGIGLGNTLPSASLHIRGGSTGSLLRLESNTSASIFSIENNGSGSFTGSFGVQGGAGNVAAADYYFTANGNGGDNTLKISNGNGFTSAGVVIERTQNTGRYALSVGSSEGGSGRFYVNSAGVISFGSAYSPIGEFGNPYNIGLSADSTLTGAVHSLWNDYSSGFHFVKTGWTHSGRAFFNIKHDWTSAEAGNATLTNLSVKPAINLTGTGTKDMIGIEYSPTVTQLTGSHYGLLIRTGQSGFGMGSSLPSASVHIRATSTGSIFIAESLTSASIFIVNNNGSSSFAGSLTVTGSVAIGDATAPAVYTSVKTTVNSGSTTIYNMPTASYDGAFFDYVLKSATGARAGNVMAVWSGSGVSFTDNSTSDLGSTSGFTFSVILSGSNMVLTSAVATNGWTLKTAVRTI